MTMTATNETKTDSTNNGEEIVTITNNATTVEEGQSNENAIEREIFEFLARNNDISFKSQQIDDPELSFDEKLQIASNLLMTNPISFLNRFGKYLSKEHLDHFKSTNNDQLTNLLNDLILNLDQKRKNVKNRRFSALKNLIDKKEYFSETEMMKREPYLYEQFIGKYLTNAEKNCRDAVPDAMEIPFSSVLMKGIEKDQIEILRKQQAKFAGEENDENSEQSTFSKQDLNDDDIVANDEIYPNIPQSYRKQWGDFEDDPKADQPSTSHLEKNENRNKSNDYVTASERQTLRQEFVELMYSKFLNGEDNSFDYSEIDNNSELDDFAQINQDKEDEYFNDSDEVDDICVKNDDDDSDDDLEIFMKHLKENEH